MSSDMLQSDVAKKQIFAGPRKEKSIATVAPARGKDFKHISLALAQLVERASHVQRLCPHSSSPSSGEEPASCYRKVAGSPGLHVEVSLGKKLNPKTAPDVAGRHFAWQPPPSVCEFMYELL